MSKATQKPAISWGEDIHLFKIEVKIMAMIILITGKITLRLKELLGKCRY